MLLLLAACATHRADAADPFTCVGPLVRPFPPVPTTHPIFNYYLVARLRSGTHQPPEQTRTDGPAPPPVRGVCGDRVRACVRGQRGVAPALCSLLQGLCCRVGIVVSQLLRMRVRVRVRRCAGAGAGFDVGARVRVRRCVRGCRLADVCVCGCK